MNQKILKFLAEEVPKDKAWIFLMIDSNEELDIVSNMQSLEERRQLLAKVDAVWSDIIEKQKAGEMPQDPDAFSKELRSHSDRFDKGIGRDG